MQWLLLSTVYCLCHRWARPESEPSATQHKVAACAASSGKHEKIRPHPARRTPLQLNAPGNLQRWPKTLTLLSPGLVITLLVSCANDGEERSQLCRQCAKHTLEEHSEAQSLLLSSRDCVIALITPLLAAPQVRQHELRAWVERADFVQALASCKWTVACVQSREARCASISPRCFMKWHKM
jgi:hypothetical protein